MADEDVAELGASVQEDMPEEGGLASACAAGDHQGAVGSGGQPVKDAVALEDATVEVPGEFAEFGAGRLGDEVTLLVGGELVDDRLKFGELVQRRGDGGGDVGGDADELVAVVVDGVAPVSAELVGELRTEFDEADGKLSAEGDGQGAFEGAGEGAKFGCAFGCGRQQEITLSVGVAGEEFSVYELGKAAGAAGVEDDDGPAVLGVGVDLAAA